MKKAFLALLCALLVLTAACSTDTPAGLANVQATSAPSAAITTAAATTTTRQTTEAAPTTTTAAQFAQLAIAAPASPTTATTQTTEPTSVQSRPSSRNYLDYFTTDRSTWNLPGFLGAIGGGWEYITHGSPINAIFFGKTLPTGEKILIDMRPYYLCGYVYEAPGNDPGVQEMLNLLSQAETFILFEHHFFGPDIVEPRPGREIYQECGTVTEDMVFILGTAFPRESIEMIIQCLERLPEMVPLEGEMHLEGPFTGRYPYYTEVEFEGKSIFAGMIDRTGRPILP